MGISGKLEGVSKKIQGHFQQVSRDFQEALKDVSTLFRVNFKGIEKDVSKKFQDFLRVLQGCSVLKFYCCMALIAAT